MMVIVSSKNLAGKTGFEPAPHGFGDQQATVTTLPCGGRGGIRTPGGGFGDRCLTTWLHSHHGHEGPLVTPKRGSRCFARSAGYGAWGYLYTTDAMCQFPFSVQLRYHTRMKARLSFPLQVYPYCQKWKTMNGRARPFAVYYGRMGYAPPHAGWTLVHPPPESLPFGSYNAVANAVRVAQGKV